VVAVLGGTGRNFAAGMSGGVAYVLDEDGSFAERCNKAMVKLEKIAPPADADDDDMPRGHSLNVGDAGMGDLLRFDAERLRILVERHLRHTGSARAKALLEDWDASLSRFVKVMPLDYAKALIAMKAAGAARVAAE
jgi:glutamate synthase (NADPH/NADH) large chain